MHYDVVKRHMLLLIHGWQQTKQEGHLSQRDRATRYVS